MCENPLVPINGEIVEIITESGTVKTFRIKPKTAIEFTPGQCVMLSLFGVGEAIFSISSGPGSPYLDLSIKQTGKVTDALHQLDVGQQIGIRGPYGNGFPMADLEGKNLLFIGGGIGLAPLRPVILAALADRASYGKIQLIYGCRTPDELIFKDDIFTKWPKEADFQVDLTVDAECPEWDGCVGFVPQHLEKLAPTPDNTVALTCGPPIMIKFVLQALEKLGFTPEQIITTLEYKMKCGIGQCGRCNIGEKYVCKDGPVFYLSEIKDLQGEF
jgi:NAD(P)H-flavin reductase